ncbi:hypothetical protein C1I98_29050 [Spongiactinospora gelatinilytica]|uniref:Uncharacterized protein n=1 Tax=Spongiactinospora gelatinilytica TaxID=2666298 RepID=A0A2W2H1P2_9ACTN|nr:hypothetical protein [Spongiactinospora gelatinilytica]PZG32954.1 hypothetical protein C1I98_29050 [Spongiactinospora gelatinilytica]
MNATAAGLPGDWVHAREEDTGGAKVYRPWGHPLPPSRWRHRIELRPDGSYVDHRLGADDRSPRARGHWTVEPGPRIRLRPDDQGEPARTLEVVAAEPGRLVLKDLP